MKADATLVAMAANDMSQLQLQKADKDMASALFGKSDKAKTENVTQTKTLPVANGAPRSVWKGVYDVKKVDEDEGKKDGQPSLLD